MPLARTIDGDRITYGSIEVRIDRPRRIAWLTISGPSSPPPTNFQALIDEGAGTWLIRTARELDDAILQLRMNEPEIGIHQIRISYFVVELGAPDHAPSSLLSGLLSAIRWPPIAPVQAICYPSSFWRMPEPSGFGAFFVTGSRHSPAQRE